MTLSINVLFMTEKELENHFMSIHLIFSEVRGHLFLCLIVHQFDFIIGAPHSNGLSNHYLLEEHYHFFMNCIILTCADIINNNISVYIYLGLGLDAVISTL